MTEIHHALEAPCVSCPYRKDVPSGVWAAEEYQKLPQYDGEIMDQLQNGGHALFLCHQMNNALCSGWLGCHGPTNLLAMRLMSEKVELNTFDYTTDIPLFASGAEAAAHGMRDIDTPNAPAQRIVARIQRKQDRRS